LAALPGQVPPWHHRFHASHALNALLTTTPDTEPTSRLMAGDFPLLLQKHLSFYPFLLSFSGRRLIEGFFFLF